MDRRDLIKILGTGLIVRPENLLAHDHPAELTPVDLAAYHPRFFTPQEHRVLGCLCNIIMPADESSPAASDAGVLFYIDSVLFYAKPDEQQVWRSGLEDVQKTAAARFGRPFEECTPQQQDQIVASMAAIDPAPIETSGSGSAVGANHVDAPLQRFFEPLKSLTIEAYWLSDAGMKQYLGYRGDIAIKQFPGCTHPEHQRP